MKKKNKKVKVILDRINAYDQHVQEHLVLIDTKLRILEKQMELTLTRLEALQALVGTPVEWNPVLQDAIDSGKISLKGVDPEEVGKWAYADGRPMTWKSSDVEVVHFDKELAEKEEKYGDGVHYCGD